MEIRSSIVISLEPLKPLFKLSDPRFQKTAEKCLFIVTKGSEENVSCFWFLLGTMTRIFCEIKLSSHSCFSIHIFSCSTSLKILCFQLFIRYNYFLRKMIFLSFSIEIWSSSSRKTLRTKASGCFSNSRICKWKFQSIPRRFVFSWKDFVFQILNCFS